MCIWQLLFPSAAIGSVGHVKHPKGRPGETLMRLSMFLTILVTGLLVAAPAAHAVPFGTVTLTQNGANVDISVSLGDSNQFVLTSPDDQYFEFNRAPSLASITVDQTAAGVLLIADTGAFSGDGAGDFFLGTATLDGR